MKANVLIVNPYITDFKLYDEWMHPVGLYFLIDLLEQHNFSTWYFDFLSPASHLHERKSGTGTFSSIEISKPAVYTAIKRKYKLYGQPQSAFESFVQQIPVPDLICVGSAMTYWAPGVLETISIIRKYFAETPIVLGGIASQLIPSYFETHLKNVFNAGSIHAATNESSGIPLLSGLNGDESNGSMISAFSKFQTAPHGPILMSLGCPMRCSYCASSVLQPVYKPGDTNRVLDEVEHLFTKYNTINFAFYDDALLYKKDCVLTPFLKGIKDRELNIRLHTPNGLHVRFIDSEVVDIMKTAGFETIRFGYESGQKRFGTAISNKISRDELSKKISITIQGGFSGCQIGVYIMGGLPSQTPQEMIEELEFVHSLGVTVKPVFISPVPGTKLFEQYAVEFPQIRTDPLWHNDSFFITNLPLWDDDTIEMIRKKSKSLNQSVVNLQQQ